MASSSLALSSLHIQTSPIHKTTDGSLIISKTIPSMRRHMARPISASISEKPSILPPQQPPSNQPNKLPIKKIPGDYGLPLIGPWSDRTDFWYNQGGNEFFKSRIQKYQSTVFRTNMPPGPFIASDSKVIALLDAKSFPVLFDVTKVEKRDIFTGTFMPSTDLTGGYRVLSYLDPSEPNHEKLKKLMFYLLSSRRDYVIPEFETSYNKLFKKLESEISSNGKVSFNDANDQSAFEFLGKSFYGVNPGDTKLGNDGPGIIQTWLLFQLHPLLTLGLPKILEDVALHSFKLPPLLIKSKYNRLLEFFNENSVDLQNEAEKLGLARDEAVHNLLFATCFNTFGGMKKFFPNLMIQVGRAGFNLHTQLAQEIRSGVKSNGGQVTMKAMEQMPLMKSTVYEALRIEPPVTSQYGRAKRDLVIESHDAAFEVKEGEMMYGYQPFATKDPKIFVRSEEFVADRFVGEEGEKLLKYVLWSNGPENESPSVSNKQCAGKDFVVLVGRLLLVLFFLRYDSFEIEVGTSALGSALTVTSLKRASF
ncbi:oxygenase [Lithospermum erythrorhizon]|uniref:Oxygenase n=1 Tax=Lithospermum erythrorhizon TaxID=34254 RepID=A0AAV3PFQ0_LITER